ncbi:DUF2247 family protein [Sanguibacter suaedae]|uniref:DUF2247 family protein n=1 Tax=Sanguibacter suaedae TaxID=2795737 RepID=A0A934MC97_9MICO|nr:DUF2247 family protein [Sanguibacter suaedae]MBI9113669.1 DUF2247 family protein [Sanguibacter suaedae]
MVKFRLPATFVVAQVRLQHGELAYGYANGWLDDASAVGIAEDLVATGAALPPVVELASVFKGELWRVPRIVDAIEVEPASAPDRVWLYLALAWLHEHKEGHADPLQVIEMLYADFDYPAEIDGLVRYLPAPPGARIGVDAIEERWRAYLYRRSTEYASRR